MGFVNQTDLDNDPELGGSAPGSSGSNRLGHAVRTFDLNLYLLCSLGCYQGMEYNPQDHSFRGSHEPENVCIFEFKSMVGLYSLWYY